MPTMWAEQALRIVTQESSFWWREIISRLPTRLEERLPSVLGRGSGGGLRRLRVFQQCLAPPLPLRRRALGARLLRRWLGLLGSRLLRRRRRRWGRRLLCLLRGGALLEGCEGCLQRADLVFEGRLPGVGLRGKLQTQYTQEAPFRPLKTQILPQLLSGEASPHLLELFAQRCVSMPRMPSASACSRAVSV